MSATEPSRRALYVSHTGMTEPLGRSQVIPYVVGLARAGWHMDIIAFEPAGVDGRRIADARAELAASGVGYLFARRSPAHDPITKLRESLRSFAMLAASAVRRGPRIVHARSYLPAIAARALTAMLPGARFLFDCRGLLADEYVDAGHWAKSSRRYRLVKRIERDLFGHADAVVTLTARLGAWLSSEAHLLPPTTPTEVIPCCVDLARFRFDAAARERVRAELGAKDRFVVTYSGTLGSWYRADDMARLFASVRRRRPALFLVLTWSPLEPLQRALAAAGVAEQDVAVRRIDPSSMAAHLSASDAAVSFITPSFSKMASSPTKLAEYLAIGLPVVLNRGVGDVDRLIAEGGGGSGIIAVDDFTADALERAADRLTSLPRSDADRAQSRACAESHFSLEHVGIPRYTRLYERLAS